MFEPVRLSQMYYICNIFISVDSNSKSWLDNFCLYVKRQIAIPITGRDNSCKNCHSNCRPPISIMAAKYSQRSHDIIRCTTGLQNYVRSILNGHPKIGDIIRPTVISHSKSTPNGASNLVRTTTAKRSTDTENTGVQRHQAETPKTQNKKNHNFTKNTREQKYREQINEHQDWTKSMSPDTTY